MISSVAMGLIGIAYIIIPFILLAAILILVVALDGSNSTTSKLVLCLGVPLSLGECWILWWIMSWNTFNILIRMSVPITLFSLLFIGLLLLEKTENNKLKNIILLSIIDIIPLLTILMVSLLAANAGISINMD